MGTLKLVLTVIQVLAALFLTFVVLALAGGAILWLMLRRDKNTRG